MPNPIHLLLRLEGPLQSWGLRARWDVRDSGDQPSKSGVIGLLGCALGYPMHDSRLEELDAALTMAVRIEQAGEILSDFHTVTGLLPTAEGKTKGRDADPATIVSRRSYLADAAFLVVLAGPADQLERCGHALAHPHWPLYLGRKSCPPSRPVLEELTDRYASIDDVLRNHPWSCAAMEACGKRPTAPLRYTVEDNSGGQQRPDSIRVNPTRMYANRTVRSGSVDPITMATEGV